MAFKAALESNRAWASSIASTDTSFFPNLAKAQAPKILWIGCSDARVPETTLMGLKPGEVFTHRNIANILNRTDINALGVIEYAVTMLKVQHVVICGHTSCGGVKAALGNSKLGVIDVWLQPMRALREKHSEILAKLQGPEKEYKLAELNVQQSVDVCRSIPTVIDATRERQIEVHGVILELASGLLKEVNTTESESDVAKRTTAFETK